MLVPTPLEELRPGDQVRRTPLSAVLTVERVHRLAHLDVVNVTVCWPDGRAHIWGEDRLTRPGGPPKTFLRVTPAPPGGGDAA